MSTVDPVDDEDMGDEQEGSGIPIPPAARRFLERHRPVQDALGSAGRNADRGNDEGNGSDGGAEEPREADGRAEVDEPEINGEPNADGSRDGEVPVVPVPHLAPRRRAKKCESSTGADPGANRETCIGEACELCAVVSSLCAGQCTHEATPTGFWRVAEHANG